MTVSERPQGDLGRCKGCGQEIVWTITAAGKRSPLNFDGTSHFANCPNAGDFRRAKQ
jgi:hypothetical protein